MKWKEEARNEKKILSDARRGAGDTRVTKVSVIRCARCNEMRHSRIESEHQLKHFKVQGVAVRGG